MRGTHPHEHAKDNMRENKTKRDVPKFELGDITKITGTWEIVAVIRTVGGGVVYEIIHAMEPEGVIRIREKLIQKVKKK